MLAGHAMRQHGSDLPNSFLLNIFSHATLTLLVFDDKTPFLPCPSSALHIPTVQALPTEKQHNKNSTRNNNKNKTPMTPTTVAMKTPFKQTSLTTAAPNNDSTAEAEAHTMSMPKPMTTTRTSRSKHSSHSMSSQPLSYYTVVYNFILDTIYFVQFYQLTRVAAQLHITRSTTSN